MSDRFLTSDRDAPVLVSRFVVEAVEHLDLHAIEESDAGRGERAYHAKMLVSLLIYGYATGVLRFTQDRASLPGPRRVPLHCRQHEPRP